VERTSPSPPFSIDARREGGNRFFPTRPQVLRIIERTETIPFPLVPIGTKKVKDNEASERLRANGLHFKKNTVGTGTTPTLIRC
jgi:hypothetical protein